MAYYGAQSVVLAFAAGVSAWTFHSVQLRVLAGFTLAVKGIAIPLAARRLLLRRLALSRDAAISTGLSTSLIVGGGLTAFAYLVTTPQLLPHGVVAAAVVPLSTAVILLGALAMVVRPTRSRSSSAGSSSRTAYSSARSRWSPHSRSSSRGHLPGHRRRGLIMLAFVSGMTRELGRRRRPS